MEDVHHDYQSYASSDDLSFSHCRGYVSSTLYDFINWYVDEKSYRAAQTHEEEEKNCL